MNLLAKKKGYFQLKKKNNILKWLQFAAFIYGAF